jgi:hypothetical protein
MTAQIQDSLQYDGERWSLVHYSAGEPFLPQVHGLHPMPMHTACWRGYVCGYAVRDDRLGLDSLEVNHRTEDPGASTPPLLNGVAPAAGGPPWKYSSIALPLAYDGTLVIARDFIQELYVHMGFHPMWKYRHAHELVFEGGRLATATCLDERLEAMRRAEKKAPDRPRGSAIDDIRDWIAKTFDRNYRK